MLKIKVHELKTHPEPFKAVMEGKKKFEFRLNDRDFNIGDIPILKEYDPVTKTYTGRVLEGLPIPYVLKNGFGLPEGYCIFSFIEKNVFVEKAKFVSKLLLTAGFSFGLCDWVYRIYLNPSAVNIGLATVAVFFFANVLVQFLPDK